MKLVYVCQAFKRQIDHQRCMLYAGILAARKSDACNGCVCPYCIAQEATKDGVKSYHRITGNGKCEFHNRHGHLADRHTMQSERKARLISKPISPYIRKKRIPKEFPEKPRVEPWRTLQLQKKPPVNVGKPIFQVNPQNIYIPSDLPSRTPDQKVLARVKDAALRGIQLEVVYVSEYLGSDRRFQYVLTASRDMVLVAKDIGKCFLQAELVDVTSSKERFLLSLQLETYAQDFELTRAVDEAMTRHECSLDQMAKILGEPRAMLKKKLARLRQ